MFREMARVRQRLPEGECREILKTTVRGVLSVLGDDGYPYGVPLNHWYSEEDGVIYFHSGKQGHKIDALRREDKASFCVTDAGVKKDGDWAYTFRSVIVFGRVRLVDDPERALEICRKICEKFPADDAFVADEIRRSGPGVLCFGLAMEHITGKTVHEA